MTITIRDATPEDVPAMLVLQRRAFQTEVERYGCATIPPMTETLEAVRALFADHCFLTAYVDDRLVGAVRGACRDGVFRPGRLSVDPEFRGRGIGARLMRAIEERFPEAVRCELFTGADSPENIHLYTKLGYRITAHVRESEFVTLVIMEKVRVREGCACVVVCPSLSAL